MPERPVLYLPCGHPCAAVASYKASTVPKEEKVLSFIISVYCKDTCKIMNNRCFFRGDVFVEKTTIQ
ncbi:MAG: hypothetical protein D3904_16285 [Candidatus Electrothrix sp. EH2]|nr:hypothetical protein [Candidatus Electrothrix sp. EH2]